MDDTGSGHPDEGTIHAWLDGALDDALAGALEAHVAGCRACAERVAEARGLIAGASRIVGALDAPSAAPTTAAAGITPIAEARAARRWMRVTPARAAIAATVLVALGLTLTYERGAKFTDLQQESTTAMVTDAAAPAPAQPRDSLLEEAVKRNVANAQPPRAVAPVPGPAIPTPEPPASGAALGDVSASQRVAVGRAAVQARREAAAGTTPDQLAGGAGSTAQRAADRTVAAAQRADSAVTLPAAPVMARAAGVASAETRAVTPVLAAAECYRVESANNTAATWGSVPLPLVLARQGSVVRILTVAGQETDSRATVSTAGDDSLLFRLRRIGFEGTLALGAPGDARAGVMRSRQASVSLESVVTASAAADSPSTPANRRTAAARRAPTPTRKEAPQLAPPAPTAEAAEVSSGVNAAPAVPVVARRIACPG